MKYELLIAQIPILLIIILLFTADSIFKGDAYTRRVASALASNLGYVCSAAYETKFASSTFTSNAAGFLVEFLPHCTNAWLLLSLWPNTPEDKTTRETVKNGITELLLVVTLALLWLLAIENNIHLQETAKYIITAIISFLLCTMTAHTIYQRNPHSVGAAFIVLGFAIYGTIQFLSFQGPRNTLEDYGFLFGFFAKIIILGGTIRLQYEFLLQKDAATKEAKFRSAEADRIFAHLEHETGTPLGELQLLLYSISRDGKITGKTREQLNQASNALQRLHAIMDSASEHHLWTFGERTAKSLTGSESSSSAQALELTAQFQRLTSTNTVNLNALLETARIAVKQIDLSSQVEITSTYNARCCCSVVPTEVVQVFINLIQNAYDAVDRSTGWIEIRTRSFRGHLLFDQAEDHSAIKEEGDIVEVSIIDNGHGIPPSVLEEIYIDGFSTRGVHDRGRGHGLAIVKALVQRNGGSILHEPRNQTNWQLGTCVRLRFPKVRCLTKTERQGKISL